MGEAGAIGRLSTDCAAAASRTAEPAVSSTSGPGPASRLSSFFPIMTDKEVPYLLSAAGASWASELKAVSSRFSASASALSLDSGSDSDSTHPTSPTSPTEATAAVLKSSPQFGTWSGAKAALVLALAVLTRYLTAWQLTTVVAAFSAVFLATATNLTLRLRQFLQPLVLRRVETGTQAVAYIQGFRHPVMDTLMSAMAMTVSIEFYTAFLPVLFWTGREDMGISMTILMALCIYSGNSLKDLVCAPRPFSPPVVRITGSSMEVHNSKEYGLPSTHTINIVSLSLYMLHWLQERAELDPAYGPIIVGAFFLITVLVVFGRLYLGMHSPVDLGAGLIVGLLLTGVWCSLDVAVVHFLRHGQNVFLFSAAMCTLALVAYPTPEDNTPSFEDHTCFVGVILGFCVAFSLQPMVVSSLLPVTASSLLPLLLRVAIGLPVVLASKAGAKEVGKAVWPAALTAMGVPLRSQKYVRALRTDAGPHGVSEGEGKGQGTALDKKPSLGEDAIDVDVLIRLTQYAALAYSVKGLVPLVFRVLRV